MAKIDLNSKELDDLLGNIPNDDELATKIVSKFLSKTQFTSIQEYLIEQLNVLNEHFSVDLNNDFEFDRLISELEPYIDADSIRDLHMLSSMLRSITSETTKTIKEFVDFIETLKMK